MLLLTNSNPAHTKLLQKKFATFLLFYTDCQFMQNRKTNIIQSLFNTSECVLFCLTIKKARKEEHAPTCLLYSKRTLSKNQKSRNKKQEILNKPKDIKNEKKLEIHNLDKCLIECNIGKIWKTHSPRCLMFFRTRLFYAFNIEWTRWS